MAKRGCCMTLKKHSAMKTKNSAFQIIVIRGILMWGLGTAAGYTILFSSVFWLYTKLFRETVSFIDLFLRTGKWAFILFPVGGLVWGVIMWSTFGEKSGKPT